MASVMCCFLFDQCQAGHAELGVRLDLEPFIWNVLMTVAALSVVFRVHELQRAFDMAKSFKGSDLHLYGDVLFEIGRSLVGRLRGQGEIGAGEQYRTLPGKFLPQIGTSNVWGWRCTAGQLTGSARLSMSRRDGVSHWLVPLSGKSCTRSKARLDHDGLNSWLQKFGHPCVGAVNGGMREM